jgi:hypothetical protein
MNPESKRKAKIGLGVGIGLDIIARLLASVGDRFFVVAVALFLVARLLFIWGCTHYALSKGLPHWLGYLGLLSVIGLVVLVLLPPRRRSEASRCCLTLQLTRPSRSGCKRGPSRAGSLIDFLGRHIRKPQLQETTLCFTPRCCSIQ